MNLIPRQIIGGHSSRVSMPAFAPDGTRFVSGDLHGRLVLFARDQPDPDAKFQLTAELLVPSAGPYSPAQVNSVAWSPCGTYVATNEYGTLRLRDPKDLTEIAAARVGRGPLAFTGGGRWLVCLFESSLRIVEVPFVERQAIALLSRGGFEYFRANTLAADPGSARLAVGDDGGRDETAMGAVLDRGTSQVTLYDVEQKAATGVLCRGETVRQLAWDQWRGHVVAAAYDGSVSIWRPDGTERQRFRPYGETYVRALAISERWLITSPEVLGGQATLDVWDARSVQRLASVAVPRGHPVSWIAVGPDERTLLTPVADGSGSAIQVWEVSE